MPQTTCRWQLMQHCGTRHTHLSPVANQRPEAPQERTTPQAREATHSTVRPKTWDASHNVILFLCHGMHPIPLFSSSVLGCIPHRYSLPLSWLLAPPAPALVIHDTSFLFCCQRRRGMRREDRGPVNKEAQEHPMRIGDGSYVYD